MFVAGRRHGLGIGLLTASMVALSACGTSGSAPRALPALSTTPAADASTAPPTSKAAELAAASAVVRQYFRLKNRLSEGVDASDLASIEAPNCPCAKFLASLSKLASANAHYFGRAVSLHLTPSADNGAVVEVLASYDTTPGGVASNSGRVIDRGPARHGVLAMFYVRKTSVGWQIFDIVNLKPGTTS